MYTFVCITPFSHRRAYVVTDILYTYSWRHSHREWWVHWHEQNMHYSFLCYPKALRSPPATVNHGEQRAPRIVRGVADEVMCYSYRLTRFILPKFTSSFLSVIVIRLIRPRHGKTHMSDLPSKNELCKAIKGKYVEDMSQTQLHQQTYVQDIVPGKLHRNEYVNQTVSKQQLNKTHIRAGYGS